ncbi:DNA primase [Patescibacteria group bacterium]
MDTVSKIKQKLDIVDIVGGYVSLKKAGKNYKGTCPFHSEKTPSFMVSPELQIYKCFGCGESGDMLSFVQKIEGVEFMDAMKQLADRAGVEIKNIKVDPNRKKKTTLFEINKKTAEFYNYLLTKHKIGKPGLDYLKKERKLKKKTIDDFLLGVAPDSWDTLNKYLVKKGFSNEELLLAGVATKGKKGLIDKFRGRVIFPLADIKGNVVGFTGRDIVGRDPKYLNTAETLIFHKSSFVYGLDKTRVDIKKKGAIFVEGQMDVIKAHENGINNVIATSGTSLTKDALKVISRYTNELIFCFDPDSAGVTAIERALDLAQPMGFDVKVAIIPDKYSDLDDLISKDYALAKNILSDPVPIYDFYLATALKKFDKSKAYEKKKIINYLIPKFSKIKNGVVFDHYIKKTAEELDVLEQTIRSSVKKNRPIEEDANLASVKGTIQSLEKHFFTLLMKAELDTMGQLLYKLKLGDFSSTKTKELYKGLKKYINSKPKAFDIKLFADSLEEELKNLVLELYLTDFGDLTPGEKRFDSEIEVTISRIQKDATRRELKKITDQLKLAELEKNTKEVESLTKKFKKLSDTLAD